jgi:hypothetical protein
MIRLAHYPQNEYTVRMAEKMGIILWQEIPIWQGIDFEDRGTMEKAQTMLGEMINRDKNRCAVCFWGVANETKPSDARNSFLLSLLEKARSIDRSRLYVAAFDLVYFNKETRHFEMDDPFTSNLDVVAQINQYGGKLVDSIGIPEEQLRKAASSAVCKINIDSDGRLAMTAAIREVFATKPAEFDPRKYLGPARDNMEKLYKHKILNVLGSDNKLAE